MPAPSPPRPKVPLSTPTVQRVLLALLPAALLAAIGASAIWGDSGVIARYELSQRLESAQAELAGVERDNQRLYRDLELLERDRTAVERAIGEGLGWAPEGTTVYRFGEK
ncbi:MAG: septum formation initiator family protein [Myxococcota bacterium]